MADHSFIQDAALEGLKASPPVAVSGAIVAGITVADWITAMTLAYLLLQIGLLIPRYIEQWKLWRQDRDERDEDLDE